MSGDLARVVLALASLLAGCARPDGEPGTAAQTSPITNGTRDDGDPAVVALSPFKGNAACTATLIAPRVVVTAGHCVSETPPFVLFGSSTSDGSGTWVAGIDVRRHPDYGGGPPIANDVAMILLAQPAPDTITPVPLYPWPFDPSYVGASIRVAGFGTTGGTMPTANIKNQGLARILDYEDTRFRLTGDPSQPCSGDSGGPAFMTKDGIEYLIGITSSGDPACVQFGRSTRVDAFVDFISAYVAETQPSAAGVGDRCYYQESCAAGMCVTALDDARIQYCATACRGDADCPDPLGCEDGLCRYATPTPGAFRAQCDTDGDCRDELCARPAAGASGLCSHACSPELVMSCPVGFQCLADTGPAQRFACLPEREDGGCAASGGGRPWPWLAALALVRRRYRRCSR